MENQTGIILLAVVYLLPFLAAIVYRIVKESVNKLNKLKKEETC